MSEGVSVPCGWSGVVIGVDGVCGLVGWEGVGALGVDDVCGLSGLDERMCGGIS